MTSKRTLIAIAYLIGLLTLVSCILSICRNSIYQDGKWANAQWLGQDIITLLLALPLLLISTFKGLRKGIVHWELTFCAILFYFVYTYSFFMFAAKLTVLYLFHLPIFGLAVIGFIICLFSIFNSKTEYVFENKGLRLTIVTYFLFISLMIAFLWLSDIFSHLLVPGHLSDTPDGNAPLIIYSLDLGIIIPLMIVSSIMLLKKSRTAYILTGIILVKTSTLGFALMAMAASMYIQELSPDSFLIILWSVLGILGAVLTVAYLSKLKILS